MQSYDIFSLFYDRLTFNIDYSRQADYILRLFDMYSKKPELLLDLGCGTGSLTIALAKCGIEMIGVDMSGGMLSIARQKADELRDNGENIDIMFVCQRMQALELYGQVDAAICTLDSINHLSGEATVQKMLGRLNRYIKNGGLFIFDANTPYKHKFILGSNTYIYDLDDIFCAWQNSYYDEKCKVKISLDFFAKQGGLYKRSHESFCEYAYTDEKMSEMLSHAGFEILDIYNEMSFDSPKNDCQRKVYVTRKTEDII